MILVTKPFIPNFKKFSKYIKQVNKSEWLTNFGPLHNELTGKIEDYLGVKNLLLVSNGTMALQIGYKALGMQGKVLTTPYSFVATSSSLAWEKIKLEYIDIEKDSLSINPKLLPTKLSKDVTGMLAVHVYGNPSKTAALDSYCKKNNIKMMYDGAHAFGIKKKGKSILLAGDASTLSLHATKVFHTVEGGAIIFKNKSDYETAKGMINFGYDKNKDIKTHGINCKLNEYQCAVGLTILDEIDSIIETRCNILEKYHKKLQDIVEIPAWDKDTNQNGAYAPVFMKNETELLQITDHLNKAGIQTRRYFYPSLNEISLYGKKVSCPVSENVSRRALALPMYTTMSSSDQNKVIDHFRSFFKKSNK